MDECEQYRTKIEDILRKSDLTTVTTKKVRHALESETGNSLNLIKKEINVFIESIFLNFQEKEEQRKKFVASPPPPKVRKVATPKVTKTTPKKSPAKVVKKVVTKKENEPKKERKPIDWPLLKVSPPLSDIIQTDLCSRPQTVKKLWEYIRTNNLQNKEDKRVIRCDDKFSQVCEGEREITAFNMNKYIQKYFETIPKEEQPKYKEILQRRENNSTMNR